MDGNIYWVWFSSLTDVNLNAKVSLLEKFGSPKAVFDAEKGAISGIDGISKHDSDMFEKRDLEKVEKIIAECRQNGERIITIEDDDYPQILKEIYAPPYVLYVAGEIPDLNENLGISVIGTRNASLYGLKMSTSISYEIAKCGGVIISGLNAGIEMESAKAAIRAGGKIVGVLGTPLKAGLNKLDIDIKGHGALISEYPPDTVPRKQFFRYRNRISAGLSRAVVVIEAPEKSGTRLFVAEALEQGKEIFAVPGNADSENGMGTLKFIKDGATPVAHGWEVAEALNDIYFGKINPDIHCREGKEAAADTKPPKKKKTIDNKKADCYIDISESEKPKSDKIIAQYHLNDEEIKLVEAFNGKACFIDELVEITGLSAGAVLSNLTMLQIKGAVKKSSGGYFELI